MKDTLVNHFGLIGKKYIFYEYVNGKKKKKFGEHTIRKQGIIQTNTVQKK